MAGWQKTDQHIERSELLIIADLTLSRHRLASLTYAFTILRSISMLLGSRFDGVAAFVKHVLP